MAQITPDLIRSAVEEINSGRRPNLTLWEMYQLLAMSMSRIGTAEDISNFPQYTASETVYKPSDTFTPPPADDKYRLSLVMSGGGPEGKNPTTTLELGEVTANQLRTLRMTQVCGGGGSGGTSSPEANAVASSGTPGSTHGVGFGGVVLPPGGNAAGGGGFPIDRDSIRYTDPVRVTIGRDGGLDPDFSETPVPLKKIEE